MPEGLHTFGRCGEAALPDVPFGGLGQALPGSLLLPQNTGAAHRLPPDGAHTFGRCGGAGQRCPMCLLADWGRHFPIPSCCRKTQGRRTGSRLMGRTLPGGTLGRGGAVRCALWRIGAGCFPIPPSAAKHWGGAPAPARQARTLPGAVPVWGVAQSDASGSSGSSGRPRAVRTARPGRSIARSAADHSSVPSSSTPAAAAPTA